MDILLTNDDGVYSIGIQILATTLKNKGHNVLIVAPDRERSACGHSMTLGRPVKLKRVDQHLLTSELNAYSCDGTPTDCVVMAYDVLGSRPDLLISGINQGPNIADDLTYSGTVCGAMEGIIFGIPSMAVSLDIKATDNGIYNEVASDVTSDIVEWIKVNPMSKGLLYNINIPNLPRTELKGIAVTRKGIRRYEDRIKEITNQFGSKSYWIGGRIEDELEEGTDVWAVSRKYVSITPVQMDMTSHDSISSMEGLERILL